MSGKPPPFRPGPDAAGLAPQEVVFQRVSEKEPMYVKARAGQ